MNLKTALVTGGLGFIGSHFVDLLLDQGVEVEIVDNLSSNTVTPEQYNTCKIDTRPIQESAKDWPKADAVFHFASVVGPFGVLGHAGEIAKGIIDDTNAVMRHCVSTNALLIDISTSEVYGHESSLTEDSEKVFRSYEVRTEYGASKMTAEVMLTNYARVNDLHYQIVRPFNVAGPREQPDGGFVLPRFIVAALTNQPITIFNDGKDRRAFTDVRDVCSAIDCISKSEHKNQIWNIGNPANEMAINSLADLVIDMVKRKQPSQTFNKIHIDPKKIHGEMFCGAVDKIPNISKTTRLTGWVPQIPISKTIMDTVDYYSTKIDSGYFFDVM
ncbi:MAG: NAD-dependent epimerase/dehydratase family protein [Candidatus Hodarchaeales archaeon]|jgi:UDP-glucose 4-epimerase